MVVFIKIFNQRWSVLSFDEQQDCSGLDIKRQICETKVSSNDFQTSKFKSYIFYTVSFNINTSLI